MLSRLVTALLTLLVLAPPAAALEVGKGAFWDAGTPTGVTTWPLDVPAGTHRLRVALDTPRRQDTFRLELLDPAGALAASATNRNQFNGEAFVATPAAGRWTVRLTPPAQPVPVRLRARAEAAPAPEAPGRALLPNLRTVPPYEFGFIAPANPLNGLYPGDAQNPPLDVAGVHPVSCAADETLPRELGGYGALRCLRLTSGPINVGEGPYDMRFTFQADVMAGEGELAPDRGAIQRGPMEQVVHFTGGASERRPAGQYSFHVTHGHFHDDNVLAYELHEVVGTELRRAGPVTKEGFCPADQLFGDWRAFTQQPSGYFGTGDSPTGNCFSFDDGHLGLTAGWGDVYRWQRPGQFVEFSGRPDGRYVVTSTVDAANEVLESDDTDNVSYAYVEVRGDQVTILERGWGASPFDPDRVVFTGPQPAGDRVAAAPGTPAPDRRAAVAPGTPAPAGTTDTASGAQASGSGAPATVVPASPARLRRRAGSLRLATARLRDGAVSVTGFARGRTVRVALQWLGGRRARTVRVRRGRFSTRFAAPLAVLEQGALVTVQRGRLRVGATTG